MSSVDKFFGRANMLLSVLSLLSLIGFIILVAAEWNTPAEGRGDALFVVVAFMALFFLSVLSASFLLIGTAFLKGWRIRWVLQLLFITTLIYLMFS